MNKRIILSAKLRKIINVLAWNKGLRPDALPLYHISNTDIMELKRMGKVDFVGHKTTGKWVNLKNN